MCFFSRLKEWFYGTTPPKNKICLDNIVKCISYYPATFPASVRDELVKIMQVLKETEQTLNEKGLTVAVVGDFSVGKSSFISALIGKDVLPISAKPTTALVTKIRYGRCEEAVVRYKDKEVRMSCQDYMRFSSYSVEDLKVLESKRTVQRFQGVTEAVVYVNSPFLKEYGICIIDTLGLNATDNDTRQTRSAINGAIAVIYVCRERGLSSNDLDFMSKNLNILDDNLFVCVNQSDMVPKREREDVVDTVSIKINYLLKQDNRIFPKNRIYPLSSKHERFAQNIVSDDEMGVYNSSLDYRSRSGFSSMREELVKYLKLNSIKARVNYAQAQYERIQTVLSRISEQRRTQIEMCIAQDNKIINDANLIIDRNQRQIEIIHGRFTQLKEQTNACLAYLVQRCIEQVENTWKINRETLLKSIVFSNSDYIQWARIEDKLFMSRKNREKAMKEIFISFSQAMVNHLNNKILIAGNQVSAQVKSLCESFYGRYGYINPLTTLDLKVADSLVINSQCAEDLFYKNITSGLWLYLRDNRQLFSVVSARVNRLFDWNGNNDRRVVGMMEETKRISLNLLSEHIHQCICELQTRLDIAINRLVQSCTYGLRMETEGKRTLIKTIEQHKDEQITCKKNEQAYFAMIDQLLISEKERIATADM